jgi:hypothetical protein
VGESGGIGGPHMGYSWGGKITTRTTPAPPIWEGGARELIRIPPLGGMTTDLSGATRRHPTTDLFGNIAKCDLSGAISTRRVFLSSQSLQSAPLASRNFRSYFLPVLYTNNLVEILTKYSV